MTDLWEIYSKKYIYLIWKSSCREECIFAGLHNKRAKHFSFLPNFLFFIFFKKKAGKGSFQRPKIVILPWKAVFADTIGSLAPL